MNRLTRADIISNEAYLTLREERRKKLIELKKLRRVEVGERLCFTFENRETIRYQIQEMMRIEHISGEDKIQFEIDVYNELIPERGTLSATMFIQITEQDQIKPLLDKLQGLDQEGTVALMVDEEKCFAKFEAGHSKEDRISAVHYVRFPLSENQRKRFRDAEVVIEVRHPAYIAGASLTAEQKQEIANDLEQ